MRDFNEHTATAAVLERMSGCSDARLKQIMTSVVTHLHAVVREVEPTMDEWMAAIRFLTETGQKCDDKRQEFILLSDTLGVSMLVDAINNRKPSGATESTVLGPFHVAGAPKKAMGDTISLDGKGDPAYVSGRVVDQGGKPIAGALLDVWQTSSDGAYDVQDPSQPEMNLRGLFTTGADGRFFFRTVKPKHYSIPTDGPVGKMLIALGRHPMRPAHIHFIVGAPGLRAGDHAHVRRRRRLSRQRRGVRGEGQPRRRLRPRMTTRRRRGGWDWAIRTTRRSTTSRWSADKRDAGIPPPRSGGGDRVAVEGARPGATIGGIARWRAPSTAFGGPPPRFAGEESGGTRSSRSRPRAPSGRSRGGRGSSRASPTRRPVSRAGSCRGLHGRR